ncbi:winged helix-turn-helix transcriptional regulator [Kitasatospora griseola]|uniref:winged helix-turn-helix transcriptional regulator n=1 Tax=Kitasatospora griseola TaxID=2064 RepID=UPI00344126B8
MPAQPVADPQLVEGALRRLAPNWTTTIVRTIAKYGPEMRVREISQHVPDISESFVSKRLAAMRRDGLVARDSTFDRSAPYHLTQQARTLGPVYRALAQWSRDHIGEDTLERADRIEDALQRLQPVETTRVVQLLADNGSMSFSRIAEESGVYRQLMTPRIARLQADGLVARVGSRNGSPYALTDAGRALAPVYAAVQHWSDRHTNESTVRVPAAIRTLAGPVSGAEGIRTAAALRRTAVPAALFSHAAPQQPRVPAAASAASGLTHGR